MMLSIRGLYQILAYVYEIINAYSIKSLMVVPFDDSAVSVPSVAV